MREDAPFCTKTLMSSGLAPRVGRASSLANPEHDKNKQKQDHAKEEEGVRVAAARLIRPSTDEGTISNPQRAEDRDGDRGSSRSVLISLRSEDYEQE
jgi:hypothetical protein